MEELILSKWDEILMLLETEHELSHIVVNTWIRPLKLYAVKDKTLYFTIDEKMGQRGIEFINKKMYDMFLVTSIKEVLQDDSIELVIDLESNLKNEPDNSSAPVYSDEYNEAISKSNLNPKYTFENFIVGDSNKHAYATCLAVADSPGLDKFNPLFLYGGAGLGKTHLMQSIAHYILQHNKKMKVLYVPSNKFTNEIVDAIKKNKTEEFRDKYRTVDVLLIDDIQYLIGKESTQQEFFDTFNALHDEGKQIILSSDKPPKEIKSLEERFRSRFEWGVPIDIHAPEYETRMAILKNKVETDGLKNIDDNILEYIASNVTYNVRELEGALNKISVYSELGKVKITEDLAKEILKDIITKDSNLAITSDLIIKTVSEHLNISIEDIKSSKRSHDIANARQIAMYLCRVYTNKGLKSIGDVFGGKDHSTVLSNIKRVEERINSDPEYAETIDVITKKLNPHN